ncbi:hypothetical protein K6T79_03015 [Mycolicibacter sp. MYC098]|uniref:Secreted protein n=1 Tax=[Mycobacterium] crassicus TaxID=2872309 RepID=A0ABU5XCK3_9MYCO|nr:hypothetical protein [Mycolicibacter sp. MYC098]
MASLVAGALLGPTVLGLNSVLPCANAEPLAAVCTDADLAHHRSCEMGYLAMYIPHGPSGDCPTLYEREVALHPQDGLLQPDFLAGCEAAGRELVELGVNRT